MKDVTICFPITPKKVLLGLIIKDGFGHGKFNGFGGKVKSDEGEPIEDATCRELKEESGLIARPSHLVKMAVIDFYRESEPMFRGHVFLCSTWRGTEKITKEMNPRWFYKKRLPYTHMWAGDKKWIRLILLDGEKIHGTVVYNTSMTAVRSFRWKRLP